MDRELPAQVEVAGLVLRLEDGWLLLVNPTYSSQVDDILCDGVGREDFLAGLGQLDEDEITEEQRAAVAEAISRFPGFEYRGLTP